MENEQTLKQKKIALAQSELHTMVFELMRDCRTQTAIIAETEWKSIVNALTIEIEGNLMVRVVDYIDRIRKGELHEPK